MSEWTPLLSLSMFDLGGDPVSQYLFGLSKSADGSGCFFERGVPDDCSRVVGWEVETNNAFIKRHGEGDFGHTFASLEEIRAALLAPEAPPLTDSEWSHALSVVEFASRVPGVAATTYVRVIVWANW